ncbi:MAG: hypothetical protein Q4A60_03385 [Pasteurellaceae bacterium]|nr:hypothetical protein [Pasteurellaceae bacterium]
MGILDSMAQQTSQQTTPPPNNQPNQGNSEAGGMQQMYQFLMDNSMQAITQTAEQIIKHKGPVEGIADLVATAMASNLQAAQQNGKTIPVQVMLQVAKDIAMTLLQQIGVPPEEIDDVFVDVILKAIEQFGDMTNGILSPEEEQQYISAVEKITELEQQRQSENGHMNPKMQSTQTEIMA